MEGLESVTLKMEGLESVTLKMKGLESVTLKMEGLESVTLKMEGLESVTLKMKGLESVTLKMEGLESVTLKMEGLESVTLKMERLESPQSPGTACSMLSGVWEEGFPAAQKTLCSKAFEVEWREWARGFRKMTHKGQPRIHVNIAACPPTVRTCRTQCLPGDHHNGGGLLSVQTTRLFLPGMPCPALTYRAQNRCALVDPGVPRADQVDVTAPGPCCLQGRCAGNSGKISHFPAGQYPDSVDCDVQLVSTLTQ
ncbi:hypothetical protein ACOMHN_010813 [Nucella lapillus]